MYFQHHTVHDTAFPLSLRVYRTPVIPSAMSLVYNLPGNVLSNAFISLSYFPLLKLYSHFWQYIFVLLFFFIKSVRQFYSFYRLHSSFLMGWIFSFITIDYMIQCPYQMATPGLWKTSHQSSYVVLNQVINQQRVTASASTADTVRKSTERQAVHVLPSLRGNSVKRQMKNQAAVLL